MLYILFCILCVSGLTYGQNSPAFLWGSSNIPFKPALKSLNGNDFAEIISPNLEDAMVLVFLEDDLQTQDFSQCKLESGETCFANLKTFKTKTFYADVVDPVKSIKSIKNNDIEVVTVSHDGKLSKKIDYQIGKIILIAFDGEIEERSEALIQHDLIMAEIFKTYENEGKVLGIYTSKENYQSLHRVRRQAGAHETSVKTIESSLDGTALLFHADKVTYVPNAQEGKSEILELGKMLLSKGENSQTINVEIQTSKLPIKFKISNKVGGYYNVSSTWKYDDKDFNNTRHIESAIGFAYYCGNVLFVNKDTESVISFDKLQMQVFYNQESKTLKFGDPWHCVGFVSNGIMSGLFVTFMLLFIMSIGITWLMDIRTMDRFDDPKGKTITINVTE